VLPGVQTSSHEDCGTDMSRRPSRTPRVRAGMACILLNLSLVRKTTARQASTRQLGPSGLSAPEPRPRQSNNGADVSTIALWGGQEWPSSCVPSPWLDMGAVLSRGQRRWAKIITTAERHCHWPEYRLSWLPPCHGMCLASAVEHPSARVGKTTVLGITATRYPCFWYHRVLATLLDRISRFLLPCGVAGRVLGTDTTP
jgi:hypothetical protein